MYCQVRRPTNHLTRTFPNQFPKRRCFATKFHGKFLQRILCRTKNGELLHLLRRKNVPWCAEAKRLQFLFLRFVCRWLGERGEFVLLCWLCEYLRLWSGSWKVHQWVKYTNFMESLPFFNLLEKKIPTTKWRHLIFNETTAWLLHTR